MRILAVITEPDEVKKILRHLVKVGPGRAAGHHPGWIRAWCNDQSVPLPAAGAFCPRSPSCLLPGAHFSSTHKGPARSQNGARRNLVPTAEDTRCNVPDRRENYGF